MTDRDRLAADLRANLPTYIANADKWWQNYADRLIALGWTRLDFDLDGKPFCPTGSAQRYHDIGECDCIERETPPCPFCGHREHRDDVCEQDLGEHGECQCADTRPRSDADIVRAAYDRLDATNIEQAAEITRLRNTLDEDRLARALERADVATGYRLSNAAPPMGPSALAAAIAKAYREDTE